MRVSSIYKKCLIFITQTGKIIMTVDLWKERPTRQRDTERRKRKKYVRARARARERRVCVWWREV